MSGSGARTSRTYRGPTADAGNTFTAAAPASHAVTISDGVRAPGSTGIPCAEANSTTSGTALGATMNFAPASMHSRACCVVNTVPAPTHAVSPSDDASAAMASTAPGVVIVSSTQVTPARTTVSTAATMRRVDDARAIATTPVEVSSSGSVGRSGISVPRFPKSRVQKYSRTQSTTLRSSSSNGANRQWSSAVHGCEMPRQTRSPTSSGVVSATDKNACWSLSLTTAPLSARSDPDPSLRSNGTGSPESNDTSRRPRAQQREARLGS